MQYRHTHYSVRDGSPAMLVAVVTNGDIILTNEDGYEWSDDPTLWRSENQWTQADWDEVNARLEAEEVHTCPPTVHFHNHEYDAPK
jgi:hypothetical protein